MKFSVGEIAEIVSPLEITNPKFPYRGGDRVTVTACGPGLPSLKADGTEGTRDYYIDGGKGVAAIDEPDLRKLPPDSHADDSTEDPGVTLVKKLLEQDAVKVKRPVKA